MQALVWLRQKMGIRSVRLAWGLAPAGSAWALVGLSRVSAELVRVHVSTILQAPADAVLLDSSWLSQALTEVGRAQRSGRHNVVMGMDAPDVVMGELKCPSDLPQDLWPAEVQLEVAQALDLPPDEVNFDFQAEICAVDSTMRFRWVGCAKSRMSEYQSWIGGASWCLTCVEPAVDASQRAAQALVGGLPSLLQQAPQDWQFRLGQARGPSQREVTSQLASRAVTWLDEAQASPVAPRLVAAGLALNAWQ